MAVYGWFVGDVLVSWAGHRDAMNFENSSYSFFDQIELEICSGTFTIRIKVCFVGGVTLIPNAAPITKFCRQEKTKILDKHISRFYHPEENAKMLCKYV